MSKIIHFIILSSNQKATNKHIIAATRSESKINLLKKEDKSEKLGKINTAPIHPAARLVNNPDKTLSLGPLNKISISSAKSYHIYPKLAF